MYMVKTLGFVTFQINFFRPYFRTKNFTPRLLRACPTVDALAVTIRLNINIDYYDDKLTQDRDAVSQAIRAAYTGLSEKDKGRLARRLNNPTESLYPLDTTTCSYKQLQYAFAPPGDACTATPAPFVFKGGGATDSLPQSSKKAQHVHGRRKYRQRQSGRRQYVTQHFVDKQRNKMRNRYHVLQQQAATNESPAVGSEDCEAVADREPAPLGGVGGSNLICRTIEVGRAANSQYFSDSDYDDDDADDDDAADSDDDFKVQPAKDHGSELVEAMQRLTVDHYTVPPAYLCTWTKQLMTDPVISPYGDVFERSAIVGHLESSKECPITGRPLQLSELVEDVTLKAEIGEFRFRGLFRS
uniref:U-box domain-containing protein n=2 Tax=Eutreptiella gymnastica TaxID=73025 RepID=A0A7S1J1D7_9EUGL|mmetsp:Transcript_58921/g.105073  ORF Transcript_58921/g.105073 Transcript_58921/m.105073 type:complete len:356 (+) Transcript_58921:71-1138(+)